MIPSASWRAGSGAALAKNNVAAAAKAIARAKNCMLEIRGELITCPAVIWTYTLDGCTYILCLCHVELTYDIRNAIRAGFTQRIQISCTNYRFGYRLWEVLDSVCKTRRCSCKIDIKAEMGPWLSGFRTERCRSSPACLDHNTRAGITTSV